MTTKSAASGTINISVNEEQFKMLQEIGLRLRTQDNRCTDAPIFIVEQKHRIYGVDPDYSDDHVVVWIDTDNDYREAEPDEHEQLEANWKDTGKVPDGWTRTAYTEIWEFVTACFTEKGCNDYLAINRHNLDEPRVSSLPATRVFAGGSYRNEEFRTIRAFLKSIDMPAPVVPAEKLAADFLQLDQPGENCFKQTLWLVAKHDEERGSDRVQLAHGAQLEPIYEGCLSILTQLVKKVRGEAA
ncbi:hypothetical protein EKK58_05275 [Candidatus Dependentiae bacterium]|nr:MAG: hypothetical protein EKK58_05275 [Candidatus Dependentiae bacterium]